GVVVNGSGGTGVGGLIPTLSQSSNNLYTANAYGWLPNQLPWLAFDGNPTTYYEADNNESGSAYPYWLSIQFSTPTLAKSYYVNFTAPAVSGLAELPLDWQVQ